MNETGKRFIAYLIRRYNGDIKKVCYILYGDTSGLKLYEFSRTLKRNGMLPFLRLCAWLFAMKNPEGWRE